MQDACQTIVKRLEPFKIANPAGKWEDWVTAAYLSRTNLSAVGYYRAEDKYFSFGASCSEVEIDCLTGDHTVSSLTTYNKLHFWQAYYFK